jgi:peptidoglycan hydrolase CwlO-like protein
MNKGDYFLSWPRRCCALRAPLFAALIMLGMTLHLSPATAQQSNSSGEHSMIWETLSERFDETLNKHEQTLTELSGRLKASENNGERLTALSDELSKQYEDLRSYNSQIGERMQERDEDLAAAYGDNERLKAALAKEKLRRLRDSIFALAAGAVLAFAVPKMLKRRL